MNRFPKHKDIDFCYHPLDVWQSGLLVRVPCGKCDGCKLHHLNEWSMRLATEIEQQPFSLFFTLTYSNEYLPTLIKCDADSSGDYSVWIKDFKQKRRVPVYDGEFIIGYKDVYRYEYPYVSGKNIFPIPVTNSDMVCIPYMSKRDIQLWIKLIRKQLKLHYGKNISFRYFIISEMGETYLRPHAHIIFFFKDFEVSEFVRQYSLYQNWAMCDKNVFFDPDNIKYCDSGTSVYLTNYANSIVNLPAVYKSTSITPFRLASKDPAIGFCHYDKTEILEKASIGVIEYDRTIQRLSSRVVLRYSSSYLNSQFPKCFRFRQMDFYRLLRIYGLLYQLRQGKFACPLWSDRLSSFLQAQDYRATLKCYDYCLEFGMSPFHYVFLLDNIYYKKDMFALRSMYQYQEQNGFDLKVARSYSNFSFLCKKCRDGLLSFSETSAFDLFLEPLGLSSSDFYHTHMEFVSDGDDLSLINVCDSDMSDDIFIPVENDDYVLEVSDILDNMVKIPKINEMLGVSPVNKFS